MSARCVPALQKKKIGKRSGCVFTVRVSVFACLGAWLGGTGARGGGGGGVGLGAGRAGGALQRRLRQAAGQRADAGLGQRGGREQPEPACSAVLQVQVLQQDLHHPHEALVVHTAVIPPHYHLQEGRGGGVGGGGLESVRAANQEQRATCFC